MHNKKSKSPMRKIPQYEVLQPYIKTRKPLQNYFIGSVITIDHTSYLEKISAQNDRSIPDPCTIQAPLMNPLGVFNKTPCTKCRSEI